MPSYRTKRIDLVLDVRSKLEFWLGHLEGARCLPVQTLPHSLEKEDDVRKDARILVYCASGARSAAAAAALRTAGYRHVIDGGGMSSASSEYSP